MFDFDAGKIIIVGVIALIFIPPKDLPRVLRQVGQFVGKMRRMATEFQGQFMDAMREADIADIRREAQKLSDAARASTGIDTLHDLNSHMTGALERPAPSTIPDQASELARAAAPGAPPRLSRCRPHRAARTPWKGASQTRAGSARRLATPPEPRSTRNHARLFKRDGA